MKLSPRLMAIAQMIPPCNVIADIGTDHAYVPIYCVKNKICNSAIACDIKEGPLKIANLNIEKYNLSNNIKTRLAYGLDDLKPDEAQTIVIAGMGGPLIIEILQKGSKAISDDTVLILQPMIAISEVRKYLLENGFVILDEKLAKEERKIYNIMSIKKGSSKFDKFDIIVGRKLFENGGELLEKYLNNKIKTVSNILQGLKKSSTKLLAQKLYQEELEYYKKALNLLKGDDLQ